MYNQNLNQSYKLSENPQNYFPSICNRNLQKQEILHLCKDSLHTRQGGILHKSLNCNILCNLARLMYNPKHQTKENHSK